MADTLLPEERSHRMRSVRQTGTTPELAVRRLVRDLGLRYRLGGMKLPGRPDLVFPKRHKVIYVHGCFWHRHVGCRKATHPSARHDYWAAKFARNVERDHENLAAVKELEWEAMVVWECELRDLKALTPRLRKFLDEGKI